MLILVAFSGCTREHYLRQADREAYCLVAEKSSDPRWAAPGFSINLDPRSRYYDPCDLVRPPMPKDDPASHGLMECVDGKKGYPCWHVDGCRGRLENPDWSACLVDYVPVTGDGKVILSTESAVRLAYVNSPSYQNQLETLYLSALDVSTERFRLDCQFFGGNDTAFTHNGRLSRTGELNTLQTDTDLLLSRRFASAGELLVGFANSFVWQFAGPDTYTATSLLNFNLVQPLLRGAGRDVALERLTIAERGLLANLRAFQRYRQGFYTNIVIGELGVTGPQRRGGFFGDTGLTGFTGTGSGGFGGVGAATGFGRAGFGAGAGMSGGGGGLSGFAGGGAGQVGGFIGLLQQQQQIHNTEESLNAQLRTLGLLEEHLQAGTIDSNQVDQFRQNIETERANLLQATNALTNSLDNYLTSTLGLPPDLPLTLDDGLIRQFQFVDPQMSALQNKTYGFLEAFGDQPQEPKVSGLKAAMTEVAELRREGSDQIVNVESDVQRFADFVALRRPTMTAQEIGQSDADLTRLTSVLNELKQRCNETEVGLKRLGDSLAPDTRRETADGTVELLTQLRSVFDELSLVQAEVRTKIVTVTPEHIDPLDALDVARANRLDWMNNRAALVDTWRLITFNADALQSHLDVEFSGDMGTINDRPFDFRAPTSRLQVGLEFDAPFERLVERNNFRQVLIDYQQDRRRLIQYEDSVHQTLRVLVRQLKQLEMNLEIQRRAVSIAIRRVDKTRSDLDEPPPPATPGQPPAQLGPTAALNLLTALSDLRSSQNNFMSVWLNYYAARMQLMRELGIMIVDDQGIWVDIPLSEATRATAEELPAPPALPEQLWELPFPEDLPQPPQLDTTADTDEGDSNTLIPLQSSLGATGCLSASVDGIGILPMSVGVGHRNRVRHYDGTSRKVNVGMKPCLPATVCRLSYGDIRRTNQSRTDNHRHTG